MSKNTPTGDLNTPKLPRGFVLWFDDWVAFYVDGKSVYQGHSLEAMEFAKLLEEHDLVYSQLFRCEAHEEDAGEAETYGHVPDNYSELLNTSYYENTYKASL